MRERIDAVSAQGARCGDPHLVERLLQRGEAQRDVGVDDAVEVDGAVDHGPERQRGPARWQVHPPVLGVHPVEGGAEDEQEVGIGQDGADLGLVDRGVDEERVAGEQAPTREAGEDGCPESLRERPGGRLRAGGDNPATEPQHDARRHADQLGEVGDLMRIGVGGRQPRDVRDGGGPRLAQHVGRDPDVAAHGRWPPGVAQREDGRRDRLLARASTPGGGPEGLEQRALVGHLVQDAARAGGRPQCGADLARQHEHGRPAHERLAEGGRDIGCPRPARDEHGGRRAGGTVKAVGRVPGGLLVPHADDARGILGVRIPEREVVHAWDAERAGHAVAMQQREDRGGDGRRSGHAYAPTRVTRTCPAARPPRAHCAGRRPPATVRRGWRPARTGPSDSTGGSPGWPPLRGCAGRARGARP